MPLLKAALIVHIEQVHKEKLFFCYWYIGSETLKSTYSSVKHKGPAEPEKREYLTKRETILGRLSSTVFYQSLFSPYYFQFEELEINFINTSVNYLLFLYVVIN